MRVLITQWLSFAPSDSFPHKLKGLLFALVSCFILFVPCVALMVIVDSLQASGFSWAIALHMLVNAVASWKLLF